MLMTKDKILQGLTDAVVAMDETGASTLAREVLNQGIDVREAIFDGLSRGMEIVGRKYERGEYFIPQMLVCSDAMNVAIEILKPHLKVADGCIAGRVVIGVVEGDTHDIGKNLVRIMLESGGFIVHDLGRDVRVQKFIDEAESVRADMICLSTLMTTAMNSMEEVIQALMNQGIRKKYKVLVGGGPVSQSFADSIQADGYASNAVHAVKKARELLTQKDHNS
ncbi:dimethylamine corrinoid protein MtbC [Desulfotignum phosphitoxidans DSM 13687]|uniref:Dimethylamine corrinoid protein MtbC n=3 Tax=Desulfotignum phosphitoxidans TaxID=190898 RepID=S0FSB2_9BACT|nr:dimethylamine corrinoid protein MtbC [Desulfotignum phosphitoxidans DSM 13687]